MTKRLRIGFVRRGYSPSGGAEAYLKRLARGVAEAGHDAQLITTGEWPQNEWPFGAVRRLQSGSPIGFANGLEQIRPQLHCDVLLALERVWNCDVYRAGDGVHRAWLARKRKFELPLERFVRDGKSYCAVLIASIAIFCSSKKLSSQIAAPAA